MTDWRALCAELVMSWDVDGCDWKPEHARRWNATVDRARAALTEPQGEGPSDAELLAAMDEAVAAFPPRHPEAEKLCAVEYEIALQVRKARAAIAADRARWGRPAAAPADDGPAVPEGREPASVAQQATALQLVPVSERLPGPGDCDAEGRCWWGAPRKGAADAGWIHRKLGEQLSHHTHWLPFHALPVPREVQP